MRSYLQPKLHRLRVDAHVTLYGGLMLILTSLLMITMFPLFRQPIPLHDLAAIKNDRATMGVILISIDQRGEYRLNTEVQPEVPIPLEQLKSTLNKQLRLMDPNEISVCIKSASTIPYGTLVAILDWLQSIGVKHIGLLKEELPVMSSDKADTV
jgi:biopolymer transport protein ExbD